MSTTTNPILNLASLSELNKLLSGFGPQTLVVIDFHAQWCPPCHAIAPFYESLAKTYTWVKFMKCDVDECKAIAQAYKISAMPTFVFIKASQKIDEIKGANRAGLEAAIKRHCGPGGSGGSGRDWGTGNRLGTDSSASSLPAVAPTAITFQSLQNQFHALSPQTKLGVGLVVAYILMVYFS